MTMPIADRSNNILEITIRIFADNIIKCSSNTRIFPTFKQKKSATVSFFKNRYFKFACSLQKNLKRLLKILNKSYILTESKIFALGVKFTVQFS